MSREEIQRNIDIGMAVNLATQKLLKQEEYTTDKDFFEKMHVQTILFFKFIRKEREVLLK